MPLTENLFWVLNHLQRDGPFGERDRLQRVIADKPYLLDFAKF